MPMSDSQPLPLRYLHRDDSNISNGSHSGSSPQDSAMVDSAAAAGATVKTEHGVIKTEPGLEVPAAAHAAAAAIPAVAAEDDDMYEDAGDLEFYDPTAPNNAYGSVYLARIPKYVWEAWDTIDEDEEIEIGKMRYWVENGQPRMQLLLDSSQPEHKGLPREYSLEISAPDVNNTYIFTEEDLPAYRTRSKARTEAAAAGIPQSLLNRVKAEDARSAHPNASPSSSASSAKAKRWQPYYRKAVPKKTRVFGKVKYEMTSQPLQNDETDRLLRDRAEAFFKPKAEVKTLHRTMLGARSTRGVVRANQPDGFIQSAAAKSGRKKQEHLKAARIPRNQLLDLVFQCFREFQYWPLRALRQRLDQPESYLRQTLEDVAVLNKAGRFANLWSLKPEFKSQETEAATDVAPDAGADDDEDDGDDDGDGDDAEEMEDVLPS